MTVDDFQADDRLARVRRARAGDREAYGDLVEELWPRLVALARGVLGTDADAEDVTQEALVHAWTRLGSLRRPEKFEPWLRKIVSRRSITHARRRKPAVEPAEIGADDPPVSDRVDAVQLLATLAPRQRAVLYLTWIEGCSDREAGRLLGIRPATVRVQRFRGLERLRRRVEERS